MIQFNSDTKDIVPLEICMELSKSYISVETAKKLIDSGDGVASLRSFLSVICQATEIRKYRSKLD